MAFRAALVAFAEDAASAPFLGHALTEIVLQQPNGEDASNPAAVRVINRNKLMEAVTGRDVDVSRRKLTELAFNIDFVDAAKKAQLERLYHDDREIYFCPNVGPHTRWSFPLQRGLADFTGRKTLANARTGTAYFWDADEKVFRSWGATAPCIDFNGHWNRYLRTQEGYANKATHPHPTSAGHGWSVTAGTVSFTYTESIPSPVLQQRTIANQRGVVLAYASVGAGQIYCDSAATLSTVNAVIGSLCMAWHGLITIALGPSGGGAAAFAGQYQGDGTFQLLKFGGLNAAASNQYRITIFPGEVGTKKQAFILGPVMIANYKAASTPDLEDWNSGTTSSDLIQQTDTMLNGITEFTFSCFFRWPAVRAGIVVIGNNVLSVQKGSGDVINVISAGWLSPMSWNNVQATLGASGGWTVGDWVHLVVRGSDAGNLGLFINGMAHASNNTEAWEPSDTDYRVKLGSAYGDFLAGSGISHARLDAVAERLGAPTWPLDLTDLNGIEAAAEVLAELDVLVHNAGALSATRQVSPHVSRDAQSMVLN